MYKFIKTYIITIILLINFGVQSQNSLIVDTIIPWKETIYKFETPNLYFLVDTTFKKPVNGWVKADFKNNLSFRHYKNGRLDGYSVFYSERKTNYNLSKILNYKNGEIQTKAIFSHKEQAIDSNTYSWGLKSFSVWNPDSLNKKLIFREIKNIDKGVVIDNLYNPETNLKRKVKYKTTNSNLLMRDKVWDLGQTFFPFELNENKDVFSFLKYNGYYYFNKCLEYNCEEGFSLFIKFFPNGSAKIVRHGKVLSSNSDWSDSASVTYNVDYQNENNITSNLFEIKNGDKIVAKGEIHPLGMFLEIQTYENGPYFNNYLEYVNQ